MQNLYTGHQHVISQRVPKKIRLQVEKAIKKRVRKEKKKRLEKKTRKKVERKGEQGRGPPDDGMASEAQYGAPRTCMLRMSRKQQCFIKITRQIMFHSGFNFLCLLTFLNPRMGHGLGYSIVHLLFSLL